MARRAPGGYLRAQNQVSHAHANCQFFLRMGAVQCSRKPKELPSARLLKQHGCLCNDSPAKEATVHAAARLTNKTQSHSVCRCAPNKQNASPLAHYGARIRPCGMVTLPGATMPGQRGTIPQLHETALPAERPAAATLGNQQTVPHSKHARFHPALAGRQA